MVYASNLEDEAWQKQVKITEKIWKKPLFNMAKNSDLRNIYHYYIPVTVNQGKSKLCMWKQKI